MKTTFVAAALIAMSSAALAGAEGGYVGGDLGTTSFSGGTGNKMSYGIFGGYRLNDTFAIEAGYRILGSEEETIVSGPYKAVAKTDLSSLHLSATAAYPVTKELNLYGRLGYSFNKASAKVTSNIPGYNFSGSESENNVLFGVGASYSLSDNLAVRTEWNRHHENFSNLSLGLAYKF
jgi:OOP family OmpA-OmpF porin